MTEQRNDSLDASPSGHSNSRVPPPHKSRWWLWLLIAIALLGGIAIWERRGATPQAKTTADRAISISAAAAKQGDIGIYFDALGTVTPVYTVTVTGRVQGEIIKIYYREGQMVRKGDPLLDIDPRPYQAAVTQTEGQLAHDQAVLTEAKIDFDRYQQAFNRNAIAKQQLDDQQQVVLQDEGTVKNDQGVLANAKVNLEYTHIVSPIDGRVGLRLIDLGNIIQANSSTPLVVITQLQPITVVFSIAEDHLAQIQEQLRKGKKLSVDAYDREQTHKIASGSLLTLDNVIDTTTGTLKLKAVFPNTDNALFPSQFVNARILVDTLQNVTLIPTPAIQRNAQGAFVYVVKSDQTVGLQLVTPGTTDGTLTTVDGLQPGATVAVNGFDKLQEGAKVNVRAPSNANGAGPPSKGGQATPDQSGKQGGKAPSGKQGGSAR